MMNTYKILFFNSMIIGTLISISSFSWFSAWIGLEINLLSLIPLLKNLKNSYPAESAMKYFITQVMASMFLLFSVILFMFMKSHIFEEAWILESILTGSALLMKMGAAPFHFWFPEALSGLNWDFVLLMLTWQKIAPMILLAYQIKNHILFFTIIIIISSMISGLQGLNQTCTRKILAYSSINHISWMMATLMDSVTIWKYYFLAYCFINMNIVLIFKNFNIFFIGQLINVFTKSKKIKIFFMLNFLSLGGLPPFLGFFPKWTTINNMIANDYYTLAGILIVLTLISLYFYLRITFSSFTINSQESLIMLFNKISYFHFFLNLVSLFGLIACSIVDSSL